MRPIPGSRARPQRHRIRAVFLQGVIHPGRAVLSLERGVDFIFAARFRLLGLPESAASADSSCELLRRSSQKSSGILMNLRLSSITSMR
jgi:hypothetical protein